MSESALQHPVATVAVTTPSVFCDWDRNRGRRGIQQLLLLLRVSQSLRARRGVRRVLGRAIGRCYGLVARRFFAIDLPVQTEIGPGLAIHHGFGLVVNGRCRIGSRVTLRQTTTLGARYGTADCPVLEDGVDVGPNSVLLGAITLGAGARVGAGAVVLRDVPAGATAVGNPARLAARALQQEESSDSLD